MKRFTFSKTVNNETFTAVEFDSFDEAIKAVEKGVYERSLQSKIGEQATQAINPLPVPAVNNPKTK